MRRILLARLAPRFREAADYAAQRLKAIEMVAIEGLPWQTAQFTELTTPDNRGLLCTTADWNVVMAEAKSANKLMPEQSSGNFWTKRGKGSHGRLGWSVCCAVPGAARLGVCVPCLSGKVLAEKGTSLRMRSKTKLPTIRRAKAKKTNGAARSHGTNGEKANKKFAKQSRRLLPCACLLCFCRVLILVLQMWCC